MQIIKSMGLEVYLNSSEITAGENWCSVGETGLWLGSILSGTLQTQRAGIGRQSWSKGTSVLQWSGTPEETEHEALEDGQMTCVFIRVTPECSEDLLGARTLQSLQKITERGGAHQCSNAVKALSWQIMGCAMRGAARKLFVVSRAMEILSHTLMDGSDDEASSDRMERANPFAPSDVERIYEAQAILMADLQNPPTVPELAQKVGLNAGKLGRGFGQIYGVPVYAYIKEQRLLQARSMLECGAIGTVMEAAYNFGYHPAHFSTEFKRRFGETPSSLVSRYR
ncbi:MAG: AraC family transcriptional regulator [Parvibaculaceae bacterium]|nr:AraC family transcriptional regulator [Parvibaculaceae bacterium]